MSDESYIAPINSFKKHQQRLARYQRRMNRKTKFSSNWKKAKAKVQQIHGRQKRPPAKQHNNDQPKPRARMH